MFLPDQYRLLDFGDGRKLERFGPYVLDRPAPAAEGLPKGDPRAWQNTDARYERTSGEAGHWLPADRSPERIAERWNIERDGLVFELKPTPSGQVGVFPEQQAAWDWLGARIAASGRPPKVLNLFAYTGGSTLAAAKAGAQVVHVDAAKNVVAWARRNAELSGLASAPIRWIAEDAGKFVEREIQRGNRYDAVILDPPSYGHGPKGELWKLDEHLPSLLRACAELTKGRLAFLLVTCHTAGIGRHELVDFLGSALTASAAQRVEGFELTIEDSQGRTFPSGTLARVTGP